METDLLTNVHGLAVALRLPRVWLIGEANAGRLPFLRVGRKRLFNIDAIRTVLAERAARGIPATQHESDGGK